MAATRSVSRARARLSLVGIVLLFAGPLLLAVALYAGGWRPLARANNGELLDPPVDVSSLQIASGDAGRQPAADLLTGQWSVVHVLEGACDRPCLEELRETRQVRTALGKDADRVQRVLLALEPGDLGPELRREHPDLAVARLAGPADWASADGVWVVDPLGNLILRYPPGHQSGGLLKDLKRLLKLSKIG